MLVDVGTGFYVEKNTKDATTFYEGKVEELGRNVKDLEQIVNSKSQNLRVVEEGECILLDCKNLHVTGSEPKKLEVASILLKAYSLRRVTVLRQKVLASQTGGGAAQAGVAS